jgi:hypothetical protein
MEVEKLIIRVSNTRLGKKVIQRHSLKLTLLEGGLNNDKNVKASASR